MFDPDFCEHRCPICIRARQGSRWANLLQAIEMFVTFSGCPWGRARQRKYGVKPDEPVPQQGRLTSRVEQSVSCFKSGFNCSQAILSTYAEDLGLDREVALKAAAGFGGGMGRMAGTCGAVTGALMVLGLKHGPVEADDQQGKETVYERVREFARRFEARNGTTACRDLIQCDIGTPKGLAMARRKRLFVTVCPKFVQDAAEILEEMLESRAPSDA